MICFYHSADLDGHCSGAIVKHKYPDCEMIGINYGDEFPWDKVKDQDVIMVDFSLQPFVPNMVNLMKFSKSLIWIDHHKTAIDEYLEYCKSGKSQPYTALDENYAACELVWDYFFQTQVTPESIFLLGRYDIWDHAADVRVMPFQWGMRLYKDTYPDNIKFWEAVFFDTSFQSKICAKGKDILEYRDSENAKYIKGFVFETTFERFKFICINRGMTNSQMFDSIWDEKKYDGMLTFVRKKGQWTVSLYTTKKDLDLSIIAKKHGGGGHKNACGFQCDELPFKY